MFRLMRLKPPNGWNAVAWELLIVTAGVLIALGAQEFVQGLHWKRDVGETRQALDAELSRDLAVFNFRRDLNECITARMSELRRWAESFRTGKPLHLKHEIVNTPGFTIRTEVWDLIDNNIASRIPLQDRLNYAGLYANMKTFRDGRLGEAEAWGEIIALQRESSLDDTEIRTIVNAADDMVGASDALAVWDTAMKRQARELGIVPDPTLWRTADPFMHRLKQDACKPYL